MIVAGTVAIVEAGSHEAATEYQGTATEVARQIRDGGGVPVGLSNATDELLRIGGIVLLVCGLLLLVGLIARSRNADT